MGKRHILTLLKTWFYGIIEVLVALPAVIYLWTEIIGTGSLYMWLLVLLLTFPAGALLYAWRPGRKRWFYSLFSVLLSAAAASVLTDSFTAFILTALFALILVSRGIVYGRERGGTPLNDFYLISSFIIYFIAFFIYREMPSLAPYQTLLHLSGITVILFTLFYANREYVRGMSTSSNKRDYGSRQVRVRNQIAVFCLVAVAFLITVSQYIEAFFSRIMAAIAALLASSPAPAYPQPDQMMPDFGFTEEAGEPSRLAEILENVLMYAAIVVVFIGVLCLFVVIFKLLRKHVFYFWNWLSGAIERFGRSEEEETPYVDEKLAIRDWQAWRRKRSEAFKHWVSAPFQKRITIDDFPTRREQVRFLYRRSLKSEINKGYRFRKQATPSEIFRELKEEDRHLEDLSEDQLAELYAQARYSEDDISEQEFQRLFRDGEES